MADLVVCGILIVIVSAAITYVVKEKKKGNKCIGCPNAGQCGQCKNAVRKKGNE